MSELRQSFSMFTVAAKREKKRNILLVTSCPFPWFVELLILQRHDRRPFPPTPFATEVARQNVIYFYFTWHFIELIWLRRSALIMASATIDDSENNEKWTEKKTSEITIKSVTGVDNDSSDRKRYFSQTKGRFATNEIHFVQFLISRRA